MLKSRVKGGICTLMEDKLLEKANNVLQIIAIKNYYEKNIHRVSNPTSFNKAFFLKEIIVRLGKGMESIDNLSKMCDTAELKVITAKDALMSDDINNEKYKQLSQFINDFRICIFEIFNTFLQLYADGKFKELDDVDFSQLFEGQTPVKENLFMEIANSQLYQSFRSTIVTGKLKIENMGLWPTADLSSKNRKLRATAHIRPDSQDMSNHEDIVEWQALMSEKVMAMDDLTADVFDIIMGKWLKEAKHFEAMVNISIDDFLRMRGLKTKLGGSGRRGGYHENQRKEIARQIDALSYTWITVQEMDFIEIIGGKRRLNKWRQESRALVLSSRFGRIGNDGSTKVQGWRVRPGDIFAKFLFGPGRQTAMLSLKALHYDPYRQTCEKRIARYLAWLWRIEKTVSEGISVKAILEGIKKELDLRNPARTKEKFEAALDRLEDDKVISGWQYESPDENIIGRPCWLRKWLEWKVIIEPPEEVLEKYKKIKSPKKDEKGFSLQGEEIKKIRKEKGLKIIQAAEEIGISVGSLSKIERGEKTSKKLAQKINKWLNKR